MRTITLVAMPEDSVVKVAFVVIRIKEEDPY